MSLNMYIAPDPDNNEAVRKESKTMNGKNNNNTATCIPSSPKHPIPISYHE